MRTFVFLTVLMVCVPICPLPSDGAVVYLNSGDNLTGWNLTNSGSTGGIVVDNTNADSTDYVMMGWSARATTMASTTSAFDETVASNTDYILTAEARLSPTHGDRDQWAGNAASELIHLKVLTVNGDVATQDATVTNSANGWTNLALSVPSERFAGHTGEKLQVYFAKDDIGGGGPVEWLRNIEITSSPVSATVTLIDGTGPSYALNGSFESGTGTDPDDWGTGLNVGGEQRLDTLTATDGNWSLVVAETLGGLINTNYDVQSGDTFDLSFDWRSAYNWDAADQVDWRLLTTSDDTTSGIVHVIASGLVTGFSDGIYRTESLMGTGTVTAADFGRDLWLEFSSSNAGTEYARVDQVNLRVNSISAIPEPSTFALAALGLLGLGWCGRRRRRRAA